MAISIWHVIPCCTPRVHLSCPRCGQERAFASSDRFRVNAHKRRLDVWLVYRCEQCDERWNRPVLERASPGAIGVDALERFHQNDRDTAWRIAFDRVDLGRRGIAADFATPVRVERATPATDIVELRLRHPCRVRLDRLLAVELALSRSAVHARAGALGVDARALRRPVRDGQTLRLG